MSAALNYPPALLRLLESLRRLPGVGPRTAERLALWLLSDTGTRALPLAEALQAAAGALRLCRQCGFFCEGELCGACADAERAAREILVVEKATDILPIERSGVFRGTYHALGGKLSPLDGVGPEHLRIQALLERLKKQKPPEVILALSADVEGMATTSYLAALLKEEGVTVSRIAHGLPAGGGLEHADMLTLRNALNERRPAL